MCTPPPKVLIALSADFGELFNALYFLMSTPAAAVVAAPFPLWKANDGRLPCPIRLYKDEGDLLELIDAIQPQVVLLFSAYLFRVNRLLDQKAVRKLLRELEKRNVAIATSDPSLGLLAGGDNAGDGFDWLRPLATRLPHLYLAPKPVDNGQPSYSFFNPALNLSAADSAQIKSKLHQQDWCAADKSRWVFVLQSADVALQCSRHENWYDTLATRLMDVVAAGRQAILLAPAECREAMTTRLEGIHAKHPPDVVVLPPQPLPVFLQILHEAEYAFYWNRYSASILYRLVNQQATFHFSEGHLVDAMPAIAPLAAAHFYPDCSWPSLNDTDILDAERIAGLAAKQSTSLFAPVLRNLQQSPTPSAILSEWLDRKHVDAT